MPAAPPPAAPGPSGPPPRVGGAAAALVTAAATLAVPAAAVSLGLWFAALAANIPGIVLGVVALTKVPDTGEVERYLRYTWACTFAYLVLYVLLLVPIMAVAIVLAALESP
ncbi:hypothetical protein [Nocardiopsis sp. LOL_012]|uniref:hypothetical protein n=1 Tax=Nocardiopsis sp. LOL_012 TaxID=3345409 RepID=UPI003A8AEA2D